MVSRDYRTILFRDELDQLLRDPEDEALRESFGGDYADALLSRIFDTDARKLAKLFPRWTTGQQTLYAINALVGEVCNGGISQFFFNPASVLRYEIVPALERIGADAIAQRYARELVRYEHAEPELGELRSHALKRADWNGYRAFKAAFESGGQPDEAKTFDAWFYAGRKGELNRLMRDYIRRHPDQFAIYCDGNPSLQRRKVSDELTLFAKGILAWLDKPLFPRIADVRFTEDARASLAQQSASAGTAAVQILRDRRHILRSLRWGARRLQLECARRPFTATVTSRLPWRRASLTFHRETTAWRIASWT